MAKRDVLTEADAAGVALVLEALRPEKRQLTWTKDEVAWRVRYRIRNEDWGWEGVPDTDRLLKLLVADRRVERVVVSVWPAIRRAMYRLPETPMFDVFKYGTSGEEWEVRLGERTICIVFQRDEADEIAKALNEARGNA